MSLSKILHNELLLFSIAFCQRVVPCEDTPNLTYNVGKEDPSHEFQGYYYQEFGGGDWSEVTIAYSAHGCDTEIQSVHVLLHPRNVKVPVGEPGHTLRFLHVESRQQEQAS